MSRITRIPAVTVLAGSTRYNQFTYHHKIWGTVYLLLKGAMEPTFMELFQDAEVISVMSLAYHNNAMDVRSSEVSKKWKGRALALELHNRGYHMIKFGQEPERGMTLMEVGDWVCSGTFVAMGHSPFIEDGVLSVLP
jgi:hypothetical protein